MKILGKHIHWLLLALLPLGAIKYVYILHGLFGFNWNISIDDAVLSTLILCLSIWSLMLLIRAYPTKVSAVTYAMLMASGIAAASVFVSSVCLQYWLKNGDNGAYLGWLHNSLPVRFFFTWLLYSWIASNAALRKNIRELDSRFQQQADASALLRDAELFKLRQQLQPHFLYNSLNSINALIMISPDKAQEMIGKLSDFLRGSVKREAEDAVSISEELLYIESYLAIESVRFGDRLQVIFEKFFDERSTMPPFLFQPILENAIKFGLYGKTGTVEIKISITTEGPLLVIQITNPFDPSCEPPRGTGFGLESVGRRLYLLFARTDLLETIKENNNFTTILKIPQSYV